MDLLDRGALESMIAGALKDCIRAHGPITPDLLASAAKRVVGVLLGAFKEQAREEVARAAHTLVLREDDPEYGRLKAKNDVLRRLNYQLAERCRAAGLMPPKEGQDDRDQSHPRAEEVRSHHHAACQGAVGGEDR